MQLEIDKLSIRFDNVSAVDQLSLCLDAGQIGCLIGPSGCGKTSLLRAIAGFEQPHQGQIIINGRRVADAHFALPPEQRRVGLMFQDYALFPHLSVRDNIGFGLRHQSARQRQARIEQLLAITELDHLANQHPHQLSGGQQQRVALARAIAPRPELLLLDEAFGSQDAERRDSLLRELQQLLKQEQITALLVTHDQAEAFAIAERLGVMRQGHLHQWASPYDLYHRPADTFVASFIGRSSWLPAKLQADGGVLTELGVLYGEIPPGLSPGHHYQLLVRPDDVIHDDQSLIQAQIIDRRFRGADFLYTIALPSGHHLLCLAPSHHNHPIGNLLGIQLKLEHLPLFPQQ